MLLFHLSTIRRDGSSRCSSWDTGKGNATLRLVPSALAIWEIAPGVCLFLKEPDVMNGLAMTASTRLNSQDGQSVSRLLRIFLVLEIVNELLDATSRALLVRTHVELLARSHSKILSNVAPRNRNLNTPNAAFLGSRRCIFEARRCATPRKLFDVR
jgi:hypothetical protein